MALKDSTGIPVTGGTRYWLVARTDKNSQNATYEWNFVWNDSSGKVAFLNGNTKNKWFPDENNLAAFGVYGTMP